MTTSTTQTVEISADAATTETIDLRGYTSGAVRMPTVWTAAALGFLVNEEDSEQTVMQTTITGEATAFTQPGAATALEIFQAAHVAADAGRGIVIEGSDSNGVAISETIVLDATDTTTVVAGTTEFTKVCAVYTANGVVLGAQDVTIRETDNTGVCTLVKATSELGADIPAQATTPTACADQMVLAGPNSDATYVTLVGTLDGETVRERVTLNAASPSAGWSNTRFDTLSRICLGEFTNAGTGSVSSRDPWVPLYSAYGDLVAYTVAANQVIPLPMELSGARYVRLWSETDGASVVQTEARRVVVSLKIAPAPQTLFAAVA